MARSVGLRRLARAVPALTSALVLAGCGSGSTSGVSVPTAPAAASSTAGMAGMAMGTTTPTLTPDAGATGAPVAAATLGSIAHSLNSISGVSYTFTVGGSDMMSAWPNGQGTLGGSPIALDAKVTKLMTMGYDSGSMEFRSVGGQLYVQSVRWDSGRSWAVVPANASGNAAATGLQTQLDQLDPRVELKLLQASQNVHLTTEGTSLPSTSHYVGEVSAAELASTTALDSTARAALGQIYPSLSIKPLSVDVWVDSQQRPVRLEIISPTPGGGLDLTMNFTGYGTPVTIPTPSPTIPLPANS